MPFPTEPGHSTEVARLALRAELLDLLLKMDLQDLSLIKHFCSQILRCHDPEVVDAFLRWREEPRIETLMQIAATLDDDSLDQLLFCAEDIQSEVMTDSQGDDSQGTP